MNVSNLRNLHFLYKNSFEEIIFRYANKTTGKYMEDCTHAEDFNTEAVVGEHCLRHSQIQYRCLFA